MINKQKKIISKKQFRNARHLDLFLRIDFDPETVMDIIELSGLKKNLYNVNEALSCIIANLYTNNELVMISSNDHVWTKLKKSGIKWASNTIISNLINILLNQNIIDRIKGVYNKKINNKGEIEEIKYRGKYWMINNLKILKSLEDKKAYKVIPKNKILVLRDNEGFDIKYKENTRFIKKSKKRIRAYNKLINQTLITYNFTSNDLYNNKPKQFLNRLNKLFYLNQTSQINLNKINNNYKCEIIKSNNSANPHKLTRLECLSNNISYINIPSKNVNFSGEILNKSLFRVFNRGSLNFGGRFYNEAFQNLNKIIRNSFKINGEKTISWDYSGFHIRMLYHMLKLDFNKECYIYTKGENDYKRTQIKYASLIMINAKNIHSAKEAIYHKLIEKDCPMTYKEIWDLIYEFKKFHEPIKHFLFSDIGVELQNLDSKIMDNILSILVDKDILGLPVHDEIIVQYQHKDFVYDLMMEEYKKIIGFYPIID